MNKKSYLIPLVLALLITILHTEQVYSKIIHNTDPMGKCLDGSYPGFYLHQGGDQTKFMIFFVGGGYCTGSSIDQVLQSCYRRSKSQLGSSNYWPPTISPGGYLSVDPSISKFATWTKIIIFYCDGAFHQGASNSPIKYKDSQIYFRGSYNTRSHLKWLSNHYNLFKAEKVLFTGASAGGIATNLWTNYMRSLVQNPNVVYSIPDSSIFMNLTSPKTGHYNIDIHVQNLYKLINVDQSTPIQQCNDKYQGQQYKCLFFQYAHQYIQGKKMVINSQYDEVGIEVVLDYNCLQKGVSGDTLAFCNQTEKTIIQNYRLEYVEFIKQFVTQKDNSVWTIACATHSYACFQEMYNVPQQKIPPNVGLTVKDAVQNFVFQNERVLAIDQGPWPNNSPCAF